MSNLGHLSTNKTWFATLGDLKAEFIKWKVEDYLMPIKSDSIQRGEVKLSFAVYGTWTDVKCHRFGFGPGGPERNLRAIYLAISAVRKMDQRGLGDLLWAASRPLALEAAQGDDPFKTLGVKRGR